MKYLFTMRSMSGPSNRKEMMFPQDDFSVMKFGYNRKRKHPAMYGIAMHLLATPVSSSANEKAFSARKLVVSDTCSRLSNDTVEDIIMIRLLTQ